MKRANSLFLSLAAMAAACLANTAYAGVVTYTTVSTPSTLGFGDPTPTPTEVDTNVLIPLWDPTLFPGDILTSVEITMPTTLIGTIDVTNNTTSSITASGTTSSTGTLSTFAPFTVSVTTGTQTIAAGATYNSPSLTGSTTFDSGLITTGLATYTGGGSLSLPYDTLTSLLLTASGGNISAIQTTTEVGDPTVTYTYTSNTGGGVPEPATLGLLGTGLAALGLRRRRRS